jgi:hypothetical protein
MPVAETPDDNFDHARSRTMTDDDLESEIELVSELVVAATSSDGPLDQDQVDQLLGLRPTQDGPAPASDR